MLLLSEWYCVFAAAFIPAMVGSDDDMSVCEKPRHCYWSLWPTNPTGRLLKQCTIGLTLRGTSLWAMAAAVSGCSPLEKWSNWPAGIVSKIVIGFF